MTDRQARVVCICVDVPAPTREGPGVLLRGVRGEDARFAPHALGVPRSVRGPAHDALADLHGHSQLESGAPMAYAGRLRPA
jgi:hypothetical protein